jgi:BirA family biotin operon repressor/biotin-[acetyl-CoA-carboxylase] ligase
MAIAEVLHLESAESTMDAARAAARDQDFLLVTAAVQTRGKGTRGRVWQSQAGNVHMTVGIHRRHLPPDRLALLPLEIGILLWEEAAARIAPESRPRLALKWPNDLLLEGAKAAGVLIEGSGEMMLVGAGVNVAQAPEVADGGSPSACLSQAGMPSGGARDFAEGFFRRLLAAYQDPAAFDPEAVLMAWQSRSDWNRRHRLRDRPGTPIVQPVSLNRHGHLLVRHADGATEWLVSEYLA